MASVVSGGCHRAPDRARPPNVILILVDTLRADHLGCYGYHRPTSPNLDRLAAEGILFAEVRSQAACTFPSVNSILTSRYPQSFIGQPEQRIGIPDDVPTVAEALRAHGYATAAVSASPLVRATPSDLNPYGGFGRGFDRFVDDLPWAPAETVDERALEVLHELRPPYFLYLHYMDPHDWYGPPEGFVRPFSGPHQGPDWILAGDPAPIERALYRDGHPVGVDASDIAHLVDLYDDEIAYLDTWLGRLMTELGRRGALDDSVVVLTSDHGEDFLANGHIRHGHSLSHAALHVPLILSAPWRFAPQRIDALVQTIDIVPTILDLVGFEGWQAHAEGRSLVPLITTGTRVNSLAFSHQSTGMSVDDGRFKLVIPPDGSGAALYDLDQDPGEVHDLRASDPEVAARLQARLDEWSRVETERAAARRLDVGEDANQRLRALGYLQ